MRPEAAEEKSSELPEDAVNSYLLLSVQWFE